MIVSMTYEVYPQKHDTYILYIGTDHKGVKHETGPVITIDPRYNPDDHLVGIQAKIERQLAQNEVDTWMADMSGIPSMEYATRREYQARLDEFVATLDVEAMFINTKQEIVLANEGKVR